MCAPQEANSLERTDKILHSLILLDRPPPDPGDAIEFVALRLAEIGDKVQQKYFSGQQVRQLAGRHLLPFVGGIDDHGQRRVGMLLRVCNAAFFYLLQLAL